MILGSLLYLAITAGLAIWVHQNTLRAELDALKAAGVVRLNETANLLRLQVDLYRALVNVIADEPFIVDALRSNEYDPIFDALLDFEVTYGAWRVDLADPKGTVVASSSLDQVGSRASTSLVQAALNNRLGFAQAVTEGQRFVRLSRGVLAEGPRPIGAVIVSVALTGLEHEWTFSPEPIVFFDSERMAFSANRSDLLLLSRDIDPEVSQMDLTATGFLAGEQLWRFSPPVGAPTNVIAVSQFVPNLHLTAEIFLDTASAQSTARLRTLLVLAGAGILGLIGAVTVQQRRRLALEALHSAELEKRVDDRTVALRNAQDKLVETSKLAALGRLSAGVSHELNQPLSAILNFAENGQKFLSAGQPAKAAQNLTFISDQVHRITRIVANLRAFAREEVAPTEAIDLIDVTKSALRLTQGDIDVAGVKLVTEIPTDAIIVLAGRVRLEQVIINLVNNALDAMSQSQEKRLTITLARDGNLARLCVRDTGTGIEAPDKVFEPFYSTKDMGASKGLGLGLALSFGIITRFGGDLSCRNLDQGAEFEVTLPVLQKAEFNHA